MRKNGELTDEQVASGAVQPSGIRELKQPALDASEVNEIGSAASSEQRFDDTQADSRVHVAALKLPSVATGLSWLDRISVLAHEANRIWSILHGDNSHATYIDAPDWQKESSRLGVQGVADGTITTPEESHASWLKAKLDDGWQYGPVKDPEAKTHPCIVPYNALPAEQQAKDAIFFGITKGLVEAQRAAEKQGSRSSTT